MMDKIRKIVIATIITLFAWGMANGLSEEIKEYYRHSKGLVMANYLLWLDAFPFVVAAGTMYLCYILMRNDKD